MTQADKLLSKFYRFPVKGTIKGNGSAVLISTPDGKVIYYDRLGKSDPFVLKVLTLHKAYESELKKARN